MSTWDLIKAGQFEEAIAAADAEYAATGSTLACRNKVIALLLLSKFEDSIQSSDFIIKLEPNGCASDYIFSGIAHWLMSEHSIAIELWKSAHHTQYADAAGGVEELLFLRFAAVKQRDKELHELALSQLRKQAKPKAKGWPMPLANYVIGNCTEEDVFAAVSDVPTLAAKQKCQAYFHTGVTKLENGDQNGFTDSCKLSSSLGPVTWLKAEFFLARAESQSRASEP